LATLFHHSAFSGTHKELIPSHPVFLAPKQVERAVCDSFKKLRAAGSFNNADLNKAIES
jgi:hypothetical protein